MQYLLKYSFGLWKGKVERFWWQCFVLPFFAIKVIVYYISLAFLGDTLANEVSSRKAKKPKLKKHCSVGK